MEINFKSKFNQSAKNAQLFGISIAYDKFGNGFFGMSKITKADISA